MQKQAIALHNTEKFDNEGIIFVPKVSFVLKFSKSNDELVGDLAFRLIACFSHECNEGNVFYC